MAWKKNAGMKTRQPELVKVKNIIERKEYLWAYTTNSGCNGVAVNTSKFQSEGLGSIPTETTTKISPVTINFAKTNCNEKHN